MKKLYYGPIVLGLAALAVGTQLGSVTTALADEAQPKTEVVDPNKDAKTNDQVSTHGTFEEAVAKYNADFAVLKGEIDNMNGQSELSDYIKQELSKEESTEITSGKILQEKIFRLRVLNYDLMESESKDLSVKNGDTTITAENVPYLSNSTAGHSEKSNYMFKTGVQNITMSDGSKLFVSFDDKGKVTKAELKDKDGKISELATDSITVSPNAAYTAAEDYFSLTFFGRDNIDTLDQSNSDVQAAKKAIPDYISWMTNDAKTATVDEINSKFNDYKTKYGHALESMIPGKETFPNPDGTIYTSEEETGNTGNTGSGNTNHSSGSTNSSKGSTNSNNSNKNNQTKDPETKPDETPTIVEHKTVFVTSTTKDVPLYNDEGKLISNRELGKDSSWVGDKMMTLNGDKYIRVATNEWVKLNDGLEIEIINETVRTKVQASLYTSTGKKISNRALSGNSPWYTDRAATINGQKMYRVATDEWVAANDIK